MLKPKLKKDKEADVVVHFVNKDEEASIRLIGAFFWGGNFFPWCKTSSMINIYCFAYPILAVGSYGT